MLGVVTGLVSEAALAGRVGKALPGGGTPAGAAKAADRLAGSGATALLSLGLAGGLAPELAPGTILVPEKVVTKSGVFATDAALNAWLGGACGTLFGGDAPVVRAADKAALHEKYGAGAVDLESGAVAAVARARSLPFAVLRVVCDPAEGDLPPAALVALDAGGGIGVTRVLRSILNHPGQMPRLLRLSAQAATARRALKRRIAGLALPAP